MKIITLIALALLLFSLNCGDQGGKPEGVCDLTDTLIIVNNFDDVDFPDDPFNFKDIYVNDSDNLAIEVEYTGIHPNRCFLLASLDVFAEARLPQASVKLFHDPNNNGLYDFQVETLDTATINLSPLKQYFLSMYPQDDTVRLMFSDNLHWVDYYVGSD